MPASKDKAMQLQSVYYGDCVQQSDFWKPTEELELE